MNDILLSTKYRCVIPVASNCRNGIGVTCHVSKMNEQQKKSPSNQRATAVIKKKKKLYSRGTLLAMLCCSGVKCPSFVCKEYDIVRHTVVPQYIRLSLASRLSYFSTPTMLCSLSPSWFMCRISLGEMSKLIFLSWASTDCSRTNCFFRRLCCLVDLRVAMIAALLLLRASSLIDPIKNKNSWRHLERKHEGQLL